MDTSDNSNDSTSDEPWSQFRHFLMKAAAVVCLYLVIYFDFPDNVDYIIHGYELNCFMVLGILIITHLFFESTPTAEIYFLGIAVICQMSAAILRAMRFADTDEKSRYYSHLALNSTSITIMIVDMYLNTKK